MERLGTLNGWPSVLMIEHRRPRKYGVEVMGDGVADVSGTLLDRSNVRILLCDKDAESGLGVLKLLQKCSYQVTCVKSAGQVMAVLDSSSLEVDLILVEVELPKEKGFKLLKHIVRQEQLQRIPVVMMSSQDEMALVVRCLRLGAVDFLLKPLRSNELLNLWTHTWRRRRMLGLTENHLMKGNLRVPLDILMSETSESNNTNGTNLFSDDTEDHKISTTVSMPPPSNHGFSHDLKLELSLKPSMVVMLEATSSEHGVKAGSLPSPPRKSELKVGQLSAFLTYNKVTSQPSSCLIDGKQLNDRDNNSTSLLRAAELQLVGHLDSGVNNVGEELRSSSCPNPYTASPEEHVVQRPPYPWISTSCRNEGELDFREAGTASGPGSLMGDIPVENTLYNEHYSQELMANSTPVTPHFLVGGPVLHCPPPMLPPPPVQLYQGLLAEEGVAPGIPNAHMPQGLTVTNSFPYYPFGLHVAAAPLQLGTFLGWPPPLMANNPLLERKLGQAERREAALNKFRLKRKGRCFEKKIRYVSRKKLAEQRPRIRGQFVRREVDNDVNDNGGMDDDDDDDDGLCDVGEGSSPESVAEYA